MDINSSNVPPITNNNHFLIRNRNLRNELLKKTDYLMFNDVYDKLTPEQKEDITNYRQTLRDFINLHKDEYLNGTPYIDFPSSPEWINISIPKY